MFDLFKGGLAARGIKAFWIFGDFHATLGDASALEGQLADKVREHMGVHKTARN